MTKKGKQIPLITCVTDLSEAHPWWLNQHVDKLIVPTEEVKMQAMNRGVDESRIVVCGLPLRKGFWDLDLSEESRRATREGLGVESGRPLVLLCGGGDGMGKLEHCAHSFFLNADAEKDRWQMVVICGKNEPLRRSLEGQVQAQRDKGRSLDVRVLGFVSNMEQWMVAADVLVTKAGPGTIAEACACGLPLLIYDFLPGQEQGNVDFVVDKGIGEYEDNVRQVAGRCARLLQDPARLQRYRAGACAAAKPRAAVDIARIILDRLQPFLPEQASDDEAAPQTPLPVTDGPDEATYEYRTSWWSWFNPRGGLINPSGESRIPSWWREVETPRSPSSGSTSAAAAAAAARPAAAAESPSMRGPPEGAAALVVGKGEM